MTQKPFIPKRIYLSCNQQLTAKPEIVFPLLCPVREYEWIDTWKCDVIYSKSGFAELDCIFSTEFPGEEKEIWITDEFKINKCIQFIRVSGKKVIRYRISLTENKNETTTAKWEQTITALNDSGNELIDNINKDEFKKKISVLEEKLNYFLKTGMCLTKKD